jgi:hypothetical protein
MNTFLYGSYKTGGVNEFPHKKKKQKEDNVLFLIWETLQYDILS